MQNLKVKISPFIWGKDNTAKIMWRVNLALLPALLVGIVFFGPFAALIVGLCIATALVSEWVFNLLTGRKNTLVDGSAILTGLLLGLMLPPHVPLYIPVLGSVFAIVVIKMAFGGLGRNLLNPAIAGRVLVSLVWPREMSHWQKPFYYLKDAFVGIDATSEATVYAISGASPLELIANHADKIVAAGIKTPVEAMKYFEKNWDYMDLFLGNVFGSIGETSALALIVGALFLYVRKIIRLDLTLSFFAGVAFFGWMLGGLHFNLGLFGGDPLFHLLSGGVMLGGFFMITDMVTHPMTGKGRMVFGILCALLTMLIRMFTFFPEGLMFAILIMNLLTPLINRLFVVYPLGYKKGE